MKDKHLRGRIFSLWMGMLIIWSVLAIRIWHLQILKGDHYLRISEKNYTRMMPVSAPRGRIYDRHGQLILGNRPFYDLVLIPQFVRDPTRIISALSSLLGMDRNHLSALMDNRHKHPKFLPITLKANLTSHQMAIIESARSVLPGVHVTQNVRRDYSTQPPPHLVGYVSKPSADQLNKLQKTYPHQSYKPSDHVGQYGLEKVWEHELRGRQGQQILHVDALGRRVDEGGVQINIPQIPAISGHHLITTLDHDLQRVATEAFRGKTGAVVVINARDGGILAMVSSPSYPGDLYQSRISMSSWQQLIDDPKKPLFDKTTGAEYSPGSTFKVIIALAALQEAIIDQQTTLNCPGRWQLGRRTFHCHKREGHGEVDLIAALSQSCNVFFYDLALKLGIERITTYAKLFKLGQALGLPLNKEAEGLIGRRWFEQGGRRWHLGHTALMGVGQGPTLITPLQLASVYATIGNGGWINTPYLVNTVVSRLSQTIYRKQPSPPRRITVIDRQHLKTVQEALKATVESDHGSGWRARVKDTSVAAKTGTVQVVTMKRNQNHSHLFSEENTAEHVKEHALIAAFSPAHQAEIAVAVVSQNDPTGGGGRAAAPVAQKIIKAYNELKQQRP